MFEEIKKKIEELKRLVREYTPDKEKMIKDMIKNVYIDIASGIKYLNQAQNELRNIAQSVRDKKRSQVDMNRFYSFVRARSSPELDLATLLDRAWNLIVMEDYDEAMSVLKNALDIDPKNTRALGLSGLVLMNKELYDEAMLYFQKVLLIEPNNPFALNNLGFICYKKGIWGEAIEHLSKVAKQTRDRVARLYANFYLGLVYYERGMIIDAIKFFEDTLKIGPNLQDAYYYLALAELKRYEFQKAVEYFERCIKIDKDSKYGRLAAEEVEKIRPLIEPERILKKHGENKTG
ncbi:MAG: tetratricopeptide repeat protein [candidate division WOR-3 bacterium]|nr:tetratricopeptide repeat protein [candidate division WOR-3 bacterium]